MKSTSSCVPAQQRDAAPPPQLVSPGEAAGVIWVTARRRRSRPPRIIAVTARRHRAGTIARDGPPAPGETAGTAARDGLSAPGEAAGAVAGDGVGDLVVGEDGRLVGGGQLTVQVDAGRVGDELLVVAHPD